MSPKSEVAAKMPLRILHLEDNSDDRKLVERELTRNGLSCKFLFVGSREEFELAIRQNEFDLIISDFALPSYGGEAALATVREFRPETPFILLSGTIGEERAVELLKKGAVDCVLKGNLHRLGPAVRRALSEAEERNMRKKAEEALRTQAGQLRALATRLQAIREEERILISREIHDALGAALTEQKFGLEWIRQRFNDHERANSGKQFFEKVDSLKAQIDTTAKLVRKLCTQLRPPILDDLGLAATIEWQVQEFRARTNIRCEIVQQPDTLNFNDQQATAMFRIFQEILTNVGRHSKASKVRVELKIVDAHLVLQVKDNGKGIGREKITGGGSLGLLGMRERALVLGGKLLIDGAPGKGTTVTVSIPVNVMAARTEKP